jgi:heme/copper-type cytochrome/quinol oxidase subunit 1
VKDALATALDLACSFILTTLLLAVVTLGMTMATVDHNTRTPTQDIPAGGTSNATTDMCGRQVCP